MTTDELRERIAETIFAPTRRDLIDVIGFDPGPLSAQSEEERARYLAIADGILALFGEPVAWGAKRLSDGVIVETHEAAESEMFVDFWKSRDDAKVVPLYALTSGSDE